MHVVVVVAGIVGAAVVYSTAGRGAAVTLVERAEPAAGATGASFAWIGRASVSGRVAAQDLRGGVLEHGRRTGDR